MVGLSCSQCCRDHPANFRPSRLGSVLLDVAPAQQQDKTELLPHVRKRPKLKSITTMQTQPEGCAPLVGTIESRLEKALGITKRPVSIPTALPNMFEDGDRSSEEIDAHRAFCGGHRWEPDPRRKERDTIVVGDKLVREMTQRLDGVMNHLNGSLWMREVNEAEEIRST